MQSLHINVLEVSKLKNLGLKTHLNGHFYVVTDVRDGRTRNLYVRHWFIGVHGGVAFQFLLYVIPNRKLTENMNWYKLIYTTIEVISITFTFW